MEIVQENIIQNVADIVRAKLEGEGSGHDWWHIVRVSNMAKRIGREERADMFVVELAALLHDIADWKFTGGDDTVGPKVAGEILTAHAIPAEVIQKVCDIISGISYKGVGVATAMETVEGKVVQDADRLDALGAIGIARAFAYGGHKNRLMYHPDIAPVMHQTKEEYIQSKGTTINHFYEKLLLLKDRMNTATGRQIAEGRHRFIEDYLERFFGEWRGEV